MTKINVSNLPAWLKWRITFDVATRNGLNDQAFKLYPPDTAAVRTIERATKKLELLINSQRK